MNSVISKDGTKIAYDRQGRGPAVIMVDGALGTRSLGSNPKLVKLLSENFTVYNFDRRGRGDSGDTQPYAVSREIEDIEALIDEAGGEAFLYGMSSGGALVLEATPKLGVKVKKIAIYEVPYNDDAEVKGIWRKYLQELTEALKQGKCGDAVALFMKLVGTPISRIEEMRRSPGWPAMEAIAPTLAYDHIYILGAENSIPLERITNIQVPALVMNGSASHPFMLTTAKTLSKAMPHAQLRILEGQTHEVNPAVLVPVLVEYFKK